MSQCAELQREGAEVERDDGSELALSSTAQSAAALVAIVGGFLVSRLVSLSTERAALGRRREEIERRRVRTYEEWEHAHDERFEVSREWFIDQHLRKLIASQGDANVDALLDDFVPLGSSDDEMRSVADELIATVKDAYKIIGATFAGGMFPPADADELRSHGIEVPQQAEEIYVAVAEELARRRRPALRSLYTTAVPRAVIGDRQVPRQERRIARERELKSALHILEADVALLDEHLDAASEAQGVRGAVLALTYLAAVGVVLPSVLMAWRPVPGD